MSFKCLNMSQLLSRIQILLRFDTQQCESKQTPGRKKRRTIFRRCLHHFCQMRIKRKLSTARAKKSLKRNSSEFTEKRRQISANTSNSRKVALPIEIVSNGVGRWWKKRTKMALKINWDQKKRQDQVGGEGGQRWSEDNLPSPLKIAQSCQRIKFRLSRAVKSFNSYTFFSFLVAHVIFVSFLHFQCWRWQFIHGNYSPGQSLL